MRHLSRGEPVTESSPLRQEVLIADGDSRCAFYFLDPKEASDHHSCARAQPRRSASSKIGLMSTGLVWRRSIPTILSRS